MSRTFLVEEGDRVTLSTGPAGTIHLNVIHEGRGGADLVYAQVRLSPAHAIEIAAELNRRAALKKGPPPTDR